MKLVPDPATAEWLAAGPELEWDAGNSTKSEMKHGFTKVNVEEILLGRVEFAGRIVEPAHGEPRFLALGAAADGRRAALVFTRRGEQFRLISCRAMRGTERRLYDGQGE